MLTLYGSLASRAHRVVWMLKELKLEFKHIPTNFQDGSTRAPEFLKINPNGRVPALDDDGFFIFESLAINLYLAKKHGGPIAPANLQEDALSTQWSFWVTTEIEKPLLLAAANLALFAPESRDGDELKAALEKLQRPFKVINEFLASRQYLIGERFTVADLNVATVLDLAPQTGLSLAPWPHLQRWHGACLSRPPAADWKDVRFSIPRPPSALGVLRMFV